MITRIVALGALLTTTVSHAATISYAADNQPTEPTLLGFFDNNTNTTRIVDVGPTFTVFLADPDGGGPMPATAFNANLTVDFELSYVFSDEIVPGFYSHVFSLTGFFEFHDANTNELLVRGDVGAAQAIMAALGTNTKVQSGLITGFDITYTVGAPIAAIFGFGGFAPGDFGFTLTSVNHGDGADLIYEDDEIVGIQPFEARSSFSGFLVPAPGAAALYAMGMLMIARRRR